ncbi:MULTISPECIES: hypothetical protein [Pseudomonas]|nr:MULTISPECIES: hypothetical protein [Pseudomonas]WLG66832.1 hypothetical protein PSH71_22940 [Pseudomonas brassicacearum]
MEEKDIVSVLSEQGWVCSKDEVGDYFWGKGIDLFIGKEKRERIYLIAS